MLSQIEQFVIDRVKQMRIERGISQAELANKLDVANSFIGQAESSKYRTKYNLNHLSKLVKIFNCGYSDFFPTA